MTEKSHQRCDVRVGSASPGSGLDSANWQSRQKAVVLRNASGTSESFFLAGQTKLRSVEDRSEFTVRPSDAVPRRLGACGSRALPPVPPGPRLLRRDPPSERALSPEAGSGRS